MALTIIGLISSMIGLSIGLFLIKQRILDKNKIETEASKLTSDAKIKAKEMLQDAQQRSINRKNFFEKEKEEFAGQIEKMERIMEVKKNSLVRREGRVTELRTLIASFEGEAHALKEASGALTGAVVDTLIKRCNLSRVTALEDIINRSDAEFRRYSELRLQRSLEWAQERAVQEARNALSEVMYRYAASMAEFDDEKDVIVPRDEIKGRIVGRGASNIALFEELFGVDVVFNDEPNTIKLSCFNLVQREISRVALEWLMKQKTIDEAMVRKSKEYAEKEVADFLLKVGRKALNRVGVGSMPDDFVRLIGRLYFRTSYGQNVLRHSFEVGFFARMIASEIGADTEISLLGGFFHDIGKAIDQEVGGSHDVLSKEILEKYGFSWEITHAAWTHHNAIPQETIEARIVQAADAISASRPGARAESLERYLVRMNELQEMALSFGGIKKAYAINAGREVRAFVDPDRVADEALDPLATDIAKCIEKKGGYPGRIKIVTIRSTKVTNKIKI